jgi:hypothetical protein
MFFFILRGGAACAPICMAAIYFCQYPWCDYDRNRRAATRSDVRAAKIVKCVFVSTPDVTGLASSNRMRDDSYGFFFRCARMQTTAQRYRIIGQQILIIKKS